MDAEHVPEHHADLHQWRSTPWRAACVGRCQTGGVTITGSGRYQISPVASNIHEVSAAASCSIQSAGALLSRPLKSQ